MGDQEGRSPGGRHGHELAGPPGSHAIRKVIVTIGFSPLRVEITKIMDNKAIANIFYETADLMKVAAADGFRIRSYERAAEALEGWPQQVSEIRSEEHTS